MKKVVGLFVLASLLLSCGDKSSHVSPSMVEDSVSESYESEGTDSASKEVIEMSIEEENKAASNRPKTVSPSPDRYKRKANRHVKESEYDNMRGFDPASEDDMDDNGMSRYMENNDDEGWD